MNKELTTAEIKAMFKNPTRKVYNLNDVVSGKIVIEPKADLALMAKQLDELHKLKSEKEKPSNQLEMMVRDLHRVTFTPIRKLENKNDREAKLIAEILNRPKKVKK